MPPPRRHRIRRIQVGSFTAIGTIREMRSRFAFVHVPKSAGSSVKNAVAQHCDAATVSPSQLDRVLFGAFDRFDEMPTRTRATIAVDGSDDLTGYDVVMGHFGVASLAPHFDLDEMMTVLREPRTRLLSHYTFWRAWSAERHTDWDPYDASRRAVSASWEAFLTDPTIASQTDNLVTRMLLTPHPSIPPDSFIDERDEDELARAASDLLDRIGFADVVESGPGLWAGLSDWLDTPIAAETTLVTSVPADLDWSVEISAAASEALTRRTRIDARLWMQIAARRNDNASALRESTFHRKLVRLTSISSPSALTPPLTPPDRNDRLPTSIRQRLAARRRD